MLFTLLWTLIFILGFKVLSQFVSESKNLFLLLILPIAIFGLFILGGNMLLDHSMDNYTDREKTNRFEIAQLQPLAILPPLLLALWIFPGGPMLAEKLEAKGHNSWLTKLVGGPFHWWEKRNS